MNLRVRIIRNIARFCALTVILAACGRESTTPVSASADSVLINNVTIVDGGGRTLMPGLIDADVHISWVISSPYAMFDTTPDYQAALTLAEAEATLMRGFTSVRDTTGQVFGAKRAIDEGLFPGPRMWASGV